jgi:hypothetical protein
VKSVLKFLAFETNETQETNYRQQSLQDETQAVNNQSLLLALGSIPGVRSVQYLGRNTVSEQTGIAVTRLALVGKYTAWISDGNVGYADCCPGFHLVVLDDTLKEAKTSCVFLSSSPYRNIISSFDGIYPCD